MTAFCNLSLADGICWSIQADDTEAARVLEHFRKAMMLRSSHGDGRKMIVSADGDSPEAGKANYSPGLDPVKYVLPSVENVDMITSQMMCLAMMIARNAQIRGGLLLHGALAEREGKGIILAGAHDVGKSTASRRLPRPWNSLSDDACLVVRDSEDRYWAHPWPTWSEFYEDGRGGTWDVQRALPLQAIFFLRQSPKDSVEEINISQTEAMLMSSTQQVATSMTRRYSDDEIKALHAEQMAAAAAMARTVPANMLYISLTGKFWEEIDSTISRSELVSDLQPAVSATSRTGNMLDVVYTGGSMNPTLRDGDLLSVSPYDSRGPGAGDVIYYRRKGEQAVVHRVVRVNDGDVITRGDNNTSNDPIPIKSEEIIGKVISARRANSRRKIPGGRLVLFFVPIKQLRKPILTQTIRFMRMPYRRLAETGILRGLLPKRLRPQVVCFQMNAYREDFKLIMTGREVGRYDNKNEIWRINPPYRFFIDEQRLPQPDKYSSIRGSLVEEINRRSQV